MQYKRTEELKRKVWQQMESRQKLKSRKLAIVEILR